MSPWKPLPGEVPEPRPVRDFLPGVMRGLGAPAPSVLGTLFSRWEEIVGPSIAAHAWPVRVVDGVLRVGVQEPAWASQLAFLGPEMLRKVVAATGDATLTAMEVKVILRRPDTTG